MLNQDGKGIRFGRTVKKPITTLWTIRVTEQTRELVTLAAKREGISIGELVDLVVLDYIRGQKAE